VTAISKMPENCSNYTLDLSPYFDLTLQGSKYTLPFYLTKNGIFTWDLRINMYSSHYDFAVWVYLGDDQVYSRSCYLVEAVPTNAVNPVCTL